MRGHKNCDKVFCEAEGAPAMPSKKRNKTKASDRFTKKLMAKKRQSRALLFKTIKNSALQGYGFFWHSSF
jgi:hypothetical protein